MKRLLILLVVVIGLSTQARAQRYMAGQKGVQITGGMVDGFKADNYYLGAGIATYNKKGDRWVFGAEYLSKSYQYGDFHIPKAQFTVEGGYYFNFLSDPSKTLFLSIGGSALAGYETSNWGVKTLSDGSTLRNKDCFVYGGTVTLELETYITDQIVFLVNVRERVLFGSSIGKFHTQFGVGLKFIL